MDSVADRIAAFGRGIGYDRAGPELGRIASAELDAYPVGYHLWPWSV
jgi:hypothetical protein